MLRNRFPVRSQKVVNGLDTDTDRAGCFVFIHVLETEVRSPGSFDNSFDDTVDWRVVAALELEILSATRFGCRAVNFAADTL